MWPELSSPAQYYEKESLKTFFLRKKIKGDFFAKKTEEEKCYPVSFSILGGRNLTRALQSSPFQNPGEVAWAWQTHGQTNSIFF